MAFESFLYSLPDCVAQGYILITTFAPDVEPIQLLRDFDGDYPWLFETYAVLVAYRKALAVPDCRTDVINRLYQPVINGVIRGWQEDINKIVDVDTHYIEQLTMSQDKVNK